MGMPRAKHPKPYEIKEGLRRQGFRTPNDGRYIRAEVLQRIYDRTTGNFKAAGWVVRVHYQWFNDRAEDGTPFGYVFAALEVPILDRHLPNYVQDTL